MYIVLLYTLYNIHYFHRFALISASFAFAFSFVLCFQYKTFPFRYMYKTFPFLAGCRLSVFEFQAILRLVQYFLCAFPILCRSCLMKTIFDMKFIGNVMNIIYRFPLSVAPCPLRPFVRLFSVFQCRNANDSKFHEALYDLV